MACFALGAGGMCAPTLASPATKGDAVAPARQEARNPAASKASPPRKPLILDTVAEERPEPQGRASRVGRVLAVTGGAALLLVGVGRTLRRRASRLPA